MSNTWLRYTRFFLAAFPLFVAALVAGCGGSSAPTAPPATYSISGAVSGDNVTSGVAITLSGAASAVATTNAAGAYSFTGLANGSYTVSAAHVGHAFAPASTAVTVSGANVTATNFLASAATTTYTLSGAVTGSGNSDVLITLSGGVNSGTTRTNASGVYSFSGLVAGSTTIAPSKAGFTFAPASSTVALAANSTNNNFVATAILVSYSISGAVSGTATAGVTMNLTGAAMATTTTAAGGTYSFTSLANGSYIVAPTLTGHTFNPNSTSVTVNGANITGTNFIASAVVVPTYTISGVVSGLFVEGISMTLSGGAAGTTLTNASGNYSFANLASGQSYTVTPSLTGYIYAPAPPSITLSANTTQNFTATSAVASYSISGTVSYAGAKTGRVYINVNWSGGGNTSSGTSIAAPGAFTIRGVPNGSYTLSAYRDNIGAGTKNASNPAGNSATVTVNNANAAGVAIALTDPAPATPTTPTGLSVNPSNTVALIFWDTPQNSNGAETATAYKIYWGTDAAASNGATITVGAMDDGVYFQSGLINGNHYYKVSSLVGTSESALSAAVGPITIGATTGSHTVSGTVTFPGTATGPMIVAAYSYTSGIFFTRIASPVSPHTYSFSGVPNGSYFNFAVIDMNNNGVIDLGDISNTDSDTPSITVNSNTTANITLTAAGAIERVTTSHWSDGTNQSYNANVAVNSGTKLAVAVTIVSAPYIAVPFDMSKDWNFGAWLNLMAVRPNVGDAFKVKVTYSDGTSEYLTSSVTGVLDNFAQTPTTSGGNRNIPTFNWAAPATPPAPYTYKLWVSQNTGGQVWNYPNDGDMPSTQTSVVYNADGRANAASLVTETPYNWTITVRDANGNEAQRQSSYTP